MEVFTEQAKGLVEGGADLIIIETAQDILEIKAAIFGAREAFKLTGRTLPIETSVSLLQRRQDAGARTSRPCSPRFISLDVDVIGLNCSTGPEDMRDAIHYLGEISPVPVHCIPNAGLPLQGRTADDLPGSDPPAETLQEFVERYGISIVGGCWPAGSHQGDRGPRGRPRRGRAPDTRRARVLDDDRHAAGAGAAPHAGGRARELAGLAQGQGSCWPTTTTACASPRTRWRAAHVLDVCVALTERQDEDEQMRQVVKRISLTQPAPIQVDSTEPDVIKAALGHPGPGDRQLGQPRGRTGQARRGRATGQVRRCPDRAHDRRVGMARAAERKLEVVRASWSWPATSIGLEREALIFDALTFTLTTGDEEWRPSAVGTIEGID